MNWGLLFSIFNFLVFFFVIRHFAKQPLRNFIAKRSEDVQSRITAIKDLHTEAMLRHRAGKDRLAKIDAEVDKIRLHVSEMNQTECELIKKQGKSQIERAGKEAVQQMEQDSAKAKEDLRVSLLIQAFTQAEDKLVNELSPERKEAVFQKSLHHLHGLQLFGAGGTAQARGAAK